jgi:hypothetical protein
MSAPEFVTAADLRAQGVRLDDLGPDEDFSMSPQEALQLAAVDVGAAMETARNVIPPLLEGIVIGQTAKEDVPNGGTLVLDLHGLMGAALAYGLALGALSARAADRRAAQGEAPGA